MAIFNAPSQPKKDVPSFAHDTPPQAAPPVRDVPSPAVADFQPTHVPQAAATRPAAAPAAEPRDALKESLIAADLTLEGKIEGAGHVRIAGRFKGDVNVQGDLTLEAGAKLNGGVRARKVIVSGELEGNIESAERVELLDSAVLTGDLKAGSLTVAAGARIRGHIESGWGDAKDTRKADARDAKKDLDLAS